MYCHSYIRMSVLVRTATQTQKRRILPSHQRMAAYRGRSGKCSTGRYSPANWWFIPYPCIVLRFFDLTSRNFSQVNDERFKIKDDFTIVLQMVTKNLSLPLKRNAATGEVISDVSYLSDDCFHLSQKGYARRKTTTIHVRMYIKGYCRYLYE